VDIIDYLVQVRPVFGTRWAGGTSWASVNLLEDSGPTVHKGTLGIKWELTLNLMRITLVSETKWSWWKQMCMKWASSYLVRQSEDLECLDHVDIDWASAEGNGIVIG